jgi:RNA polymerase sigma factor (sigma-70 family)
VTVAFSDVTVRGRRQRSATPAAIEELFRSRQGDFLRVATAIAGSREAGRDAVQEGLARALAGRAGFRGSGTLEAWLWRTIVNAARNVRTRSPLVAESGGDEAGTGERPDEHREAVRRAVAQLPERQRLVLFLRYYADLDYAAIAAAVGIRRGTVSATLNHAHAALRQELAEEVLP